MVIIPEVHSGVQIALNWKELELPVGNAPLPALGQPRDTSACAWKGTDSVFSRLMMCAVIIPALASRGQLGGLTGSQGKRFHYPILPNPGRFGGFDTIEFHSLIFLGCVCQLSLPTHPPLTNPRF